MRRIIFTFICCMLFMAATAQRITHKYNNVSLSEALRQLNEQSEEYTISFLYNELEDFRITASVHRKSVPDAIRQMIGFYPIRMSIDSTEIPARSLRQHRPAFASGFHADYWWSIE